MAMIRVHDARIRREDYRAGLIVLTVRQALGDKRTKLGDLFPSLKRKGQRSGVSVASVRANFRAFIAGQKAQKEKQSGGTGD